MSRRRIYEDIGVACGLRLLQGLCEIPCVRLDELRIFSLAAIPPAGEASLWVEVDDQRFFAGAAGVLYGHSFANIKPTTFDYNMSIEILVIVVLGGMGSVPGSVISAIVLTVLPEALREVADYRMLVYAIVLILVMQATNNPTMKRFFASANEKLTPGRKERAAL